MKIQLFSDFHLEKRDIIYPKPEADILVLAGDICEFDYLDSKRAFFMYVNLNWKKVIWILGNHEYYSAQSNIDIIIRYTQTNSVIETIRQTWQTKIQILYLLAH